MLALCYINWVGTPEEFKEYGERFESIIDGIEGIDLKGVFAPSSEWSAVVLLEAVSFEKVLEVWRTYMKKYGPHQKISLGKVELLFTFEEVGLTL